ncbi:MAG TPA: hypothetical protein VF752_13815 [Thermoleophilaceae bacterium]
MRQLHAGHESDWLIGVVVGDQQVVVGVLEKAPRRVFQWSAVEERAGSGQRVLVAGAETADLDVHHEMRAARDSA